MSSQKISQLKWGVERGPSLSGLLSEDVLVTRFEIRPREADLKGFQRLLKAMPDCTQDWAMVIERATQLCNSRHLLGFLEPEAVAFEPDGYEKALAFLDAEATRPHEVFIKTTHPTKRISAFGTEYVLCQFVLDIDRPELLRSVLADFRTFDMVRLLVCGIDADEHEIASQLQAAFLERKFLLDDLLENIPILAFFDYSGERLYLESASAQLMQRVGGDFGVTPEERSAPKETKSYHRSIWWGRKKLFEW